MRKYSGNKMPILLNLERETLAEIDLASTEKSVSRTTFIKQCIQRNLNYYKSNERHIFLHMKQLGGNNV
jgi:metal-responsive CopG/Arc/MetJ family transcriptional regulator